ncbi:MAG: ankyrin repeat domain-containing protein [Christensenella sp.]
MVRMFYTVLTEEKQKLLDERLFNAIRSNNLFVVEDEVEAGANVNARNKYDECPLHISLQQADIDITQYLLENNADLNLQDNKGHTPLYEAVRQQHFNCAELFVKYEADMYIKDNKGDTVFGMAIKEGYLKGKEFLISNGYVPTEEDLQQIKNQELLTAIYNNKLQEVKDAVKHGADVNAKDLYGYTALYNSVSKQISIMEYLLRCGALPNSQGDTINQWTVLHRAVTHRNSKYINLLLKYNADMYIEDTEGRNPFVLALCRRLPGMAEILVLNGYMPSEKDFNTLPYIGRKEPLMKYFMDLAQKVKVTAMQKEAENSYEYGDIIEI